MIQPVELPKNPATLDTLHNIDGRCDSLLSEDRGSVESPEDVEMEEISRHEKLGKDEEVINIENIENVKRKLESTKH